VRACPRGVGKTGMRPTNHNLPQGRLEFAESEALAVCGRTGCGTVIVVVMRQIHAALP